jgi:hypothetical protein
MDQINTTRIKISAPAFAGVSGIQCQWGNRIMSSEADETRGTCHADEDQYRRTN